MSEAEAGGGRTEMERKIIQRSLQDDAFRQRLLEDPKAAVEQELGSRLPEEVRVVTVEETADTIYLVLPPRVLPSTSMAGGEGEELSDQVLESVAGGSTPGGYTNDGSDTCDANDFGCYEVCTQDG